jgi:predicted XRE-type DNA-binding protein
VSGKEKKRRFERDNHLAQVAAMYLRGERQSQIAEKLGVTQQQVSYDVRSLRELWRKSALVDIDAAAGKELARIDEMEVAYWSEWERSREQQTKRRSLKTARSRPRRGKNQVAGDDQMETERYAEEFEEVNDLLGDTRYLDGVQWCITQRCKILGLYAPVKSQSEISGKDGGAIEINNAGKLRLAYMELTPDESETVNDILADVGVRGFAGQ